MLVRDHFLPKSQSTFSIKSILVTAVIIVFVVLHIVGAMFIDRAVAARSSGAPILAPSGD
jgi:hypothetical protein